MTSLSKTNSPNYKRKTARISVKSPTYVNLESSSKEHQHEKTPSAPPRKKSLSPSHAPLKSTSSRSTYQTTSSSPTESPTPIHVAPPPKLQFVIPIKLESQELLLQQTPPHDPYVSTIFEQLSLMGYVSTWKRISEKRTKNQAKTDKTEHRMEKHGKEKVKSKPKSTKVKVNVNPEKSKDPVVQADEAASTGVDVRYGGATTTVTNLKAGQGSGNIDKTPTMPHDSPLPRVNTLGSDEGSMTLQELTVFCTTLSKKVKKLERAAKTNQARRRARIFVSDDEDDLEDPSKQERKIDEIDQDPNISLVQHDAEIQGRHGQDMKFNFDFDAAKEVSTSEKDVSTAKPVSTAGASVTTDSVSISIVSPTRRVSTAYDITMAETLVYIRRSATKDKAMRLQAKLEEEKRQRIAMVHEAASSFNVEE
ncbi:hypothetical protein Tco_0774317 [Tanacetum coccineum]|uniref:Uncharacterized protein n=1 Tax=Tanacetum coccineum TaxID=301880 RepID=A0ABQ4ZQR2_9ASTR